MKAKNAATIHSGSFRTRIIYIMRVDIIQLDQKVYSKCNTCRRRSDRIVVPATVKFQQISLSWIYCLVQRSMTTSMQSVVYKFYLLSEISDTDTCLNEKYTVPQYKRERRTCDFKLPFYNKINLAKCNFL